MSGQPKATTVEEYLKEACEKQVARLLAEADAQVEAFQTAAAELRTKFAALPDTPSQENAAPNSSSSNHAH